MFLWRTSQETLQSLSNWCKDCFWINLLLSFKVFTLLTLYLPAGQIRGQVSVCRAWNALPNNVEHKVGAIMEPFRSCQQYVRVCNTVGKVWIVTTCSIPSRFLHEGSSKTINSFAPDFVWGCQRYQACLRICAQPTEWWRKTTPSE